MSPTHPSRQSYVTLDCYVRADAISDPVESRVETIQALTSEGPVNEVTVQAWPSEIIISPMTADLEVIELYRTFERWATQWSVRLNPAFTLETRTSTITDESHEVLRPPALCLSVSIDGRLMEVFPHRTGNTTYTVEDAIDALTDDATPVNTNIRTPRQTGDCPACNSPLLNGQGLYECKTCGWVAIATGPDQYRQTMPPTRHDARTNVSDQTESTATLTESGHDPIG